MARQSEEGKQGPRVRPRAGSRVYSKGPRRNWLRYLGILAYLAPKLTRIYLKKREGGKGFPLTPLESIEILHQLLGRRLLRMLFRRIRAGGAEQNRSLPTGPRRKTAWSHPDAGLGNRKRGRKSRPGKRKKHRQVPFPDWFPLLCTPCGANRPAGTRSGGRGRF